MPIAFDFFFFFFNDTATTEIYTLSLHDALPILRTTPARKPRTECCCHSVAVMIAAIVAPAGARNIARIRACLVSRRIEVSWGERADRVRRLDLLVVRAAERGEALDFGLDL